jgi:hypothetical protein
MDATVIGVVVGVVNLVVSVVIVSMVRRGNRSGPPTFSRVRFFNATAAQRDVRVRYATASPPAGEENDVRHYPDTIPPTGGNPLDWHTVAAGATLDIPLPLPGFSIRGAGIEAQGLPFRGAAVGSNEPADRGVPAVFGTLRVANASLVLEVHSVVSDGEYASVSSSSP